MIAKAAPTASDHSSPSYPLIYILTLNWQRPLDTAAFLSTCYALSYPSVRLLVVDNGSEDDSVAHIQSEYPQVELITNVRNLGFAAGMNVGIRHALQQGAEYIFLANNDTLVAADLLDRLVATAINYSADIVAPAIFYADHPERPWSLGGQRRRWSMDVTHCIEEQRYLDAREPFYVDFVTGCGMLVHRDCLLELGLFDERYFMYYEDLDYSVRTRNVGRRIMVEPRAKMWHKVAVSSGGSDSPSERYHMALASVQFYRKHVRGTHWGIVGPYRTVSAVKTVVRLLFRQRHEAATAYLRGLWDGLRA